MNLREDFLISRVFELDILFVQSKLKYSTKIWGRNLGNFGNHVHHSCTSNAAHDHARGRRE